MTLYMFHALYVWWSAPTSIYMWRITWYLLLFWALVCPHMIKHFLSWHYPCEIVYQALFCIASDKKLGQDKANMINTLEFTTNGLLVDLSQFSQRLWNYCIIIHACAHTHYTCSMPWRWWVSWKRPRMTFWTLLLESYIWATLLLPCIIRCVRVYIHVL